MSIRDVAEGESLIPAIERDFPELSGWWKGKCIYLLKSVWAIKANETLALAESEFQQCDKCSKIDLDISQYRRESDNISRGPVHQSWAELKASAIAGCHLCKLFYFAKIESDKQSGKSHGASLKGPVYVHRTGSLLEVGTNPTNSIRFKVSTDKGISYGPFGY